MVDNYDLKCKARIGVGARFVLSEGSCQKQFGWLEEQARVIEKKKTFSNTEICPVFDTSRVL